MTMSFDKLTDDQQRQAQARFFNARAGDGYFYFLDAPGGRVFVRNRNRNPDPAGPLVLYRR